MFNKIHILALLMCVNTFSQEAGIFNNPPPNLNLPAILTEENGIPKTTGFGSIETKWIHTSSEAAATLLQSFGSGADNGIKQIIRNILLNANIPENRINQLKINFTSGAIEELSIDKKAIVFKDDFAAKYKEDKMFLITKLYRTKNVKLEIIQENTASLDSAVSAALSDGIRFGNKSESTQSNIMIIELPFLTYGFEKSPFSVIRVEDKRVSIILGVLTDVNINSVTTLKALEGAKNDIFMKVGSPLLPQIIEFNVSTGSPVNSFRINGSEFYSLRFVELFGNKLTVSLTGFMISFE